MFDLAHSNLPQVIAWLDAFAESFDFTRPGVDQSLGRDLVNAVCEGIHDRSVTLRKGADADWPDLSDTPHGGRPGYRTWKRDKYGIDNEPNSRTGQMLSINSLRGRTQYQPKEILIVYGVDAPPTSSAAPTGYLSPADQEVTDVEKAGFAAEKGRSFFELDDTIEAGALQVASDNLTQYILSVG